MEWVILVKLELYLGINLVLVVNIVKLLLGVIKKFFFNIMLRLLFLLEVVLKFGVLLLNIIFIKLWVYIKLGLGCLLLKFFRGILFFIVFRGVFKCCLKIFLV